MVRFLLHTKVSTPVKFEHQRKHEIFLNLDITIEDNKLVYKLFDKRDKCFFLCYMYALSVEQYSIIRILWFSIFRVSRDGSKDTKTDRLCAKSTQLHTRMITQGRKKASILCQIKKAFQKHPETFSDYFRSYRQLIKEIIMY